MLNRRSFLVAAGTIILGQLISSCNGSNQANLRVRLLQNSLPPQLLPGFRKQLTQAVNLDFKAEEQLLDLFNLLVTWQKQTESPEKPKQLLPFSRSQAPQVADLITLGDFWLEKAIQKQLIEPLSLEKLPGWTRLPQPWQKLVRRNQEGQLDEKGAIWAAPYRWGSTAIAYRRDLCKPLGWYPTDWSDLWREEVRDRISLLDQPREVIGLTLKKLGYSYNTVDLNQVPHLKSELQALHQQVKFYDSKFYLQPLILGDTWLAVGWSHDILPIAERYPNIEAVIPQSGTSLWADLWVQPRLTKSAENNLDIIEQWIDFCWQIQSAKQISLFSNAASPIILGLKPEELAKDLLDNPLLFINEQILKQSEFLLPLAEATSKQYKSLWQESVISA